MNLTGLLLSRMIHVLAQKVKDAQCKEDTLQEQDKAVNQNSILDNLSLAYEQLIFKFNSIDPQVKCSEIVVSVNVTKVMSGVITSVIMALRVSLPMVGLEVGMTMSDATGCKWVSYCDTLCTHFVMLCYKGYVKCMQKSILMQSV